MDWDDHELKTEATKNRYFVVNSVHFLTYLKPISLAQGLMLETKNSDISWTMSSLSLIKFLLQVLIVPSVISFELFISVSTPINELAEINKASQLNVVLKYKFQNSK